MADRCLVPFSTLTCVLSTVVTLVVGCAGDISAPETYPDAAVADSGGPPEEAEPLAPRAWQNMDPAERARFMSEVVMPTMRDLFVEADADRFASFSCGTCHGSGAADGTFSMPSSDVPALGGAPASSDEEHKQRMTDFMRNIVKPKMAELLGNSELRCSSCHPTAQVD